MLRDAISSLDLTLYPEIALTIFLMVFAAVSFRTFRSISRSQDRRLAHMPLSDECGPQVVSAQDSAS